jgi:hypothetical protein
MTTVRAGLDGGLQFATVEGASGLLITIKGSSRTFVPWANVEYVDIADAADSKGPRKASGTG